MPLIKSHSTMSFHVQLGEIDKSRTEQNKLEQDNEPQSNFRFSLEYYGG